jgi:hypothetical protein
MSRFLSQDATCLQSRALDLQQKEGRLWQAQGRGGGGEGRAQAASNEDAVRLHEQRVNMLRDEIDALTLTRDRLLADTEGLLVCESAREGERELWLELVCISSLSLPLSLSFALVPSLFLNLTVCV